MSQIRVSVEYIPDKTGKIEKWGTVARIPKELPEKAKLHSQLSESMVETIASVVKLP